MQAAAAPVQIISAESLTRYLPGEFPQQARPVKAALGGGKKSHSGALVEAIHQPFPFEYALTL